MKNELDRSISSLQAVTDLIMHIEGKEVVPKGLSLLLDGIAKELKEVSEEIPSH